jgi:hypothetical protein
MPVKKHADENMNGLCYRTMGRGGGESPPPNGSRPVPEEASGTGLDFQKYGRTKMKKMFCMRDTEGLPATTTPRWSNL